MAPGIYFPFIGKECSCSFVKVLFLPLLCNTVFSEALKLSRVLGEDR